MCLWTKIAVTNRHLCSVPLVDQIERIAMGENPPDALILREKDLPEEEYQELAQEVMACCQKYGIDCILHTYFEAADELECCRIHLPLPVFIENRRLLTEFKTIGVSVHSAEEAMLAQNAGASYLTAGHIFATDCKKGVKPRGLDFLKEVCQTVRIPVYAIGGMAFENLPQVVSKGAKGICVMSGYMYS